MTVDTSIPRSRRALLAGGIGGMVAVVASAFGRPLAAHAADGDPLLLGKSNTASAPTVLERSVSPGGPIGEDGGLMVRVTGQTIGYAINASGSYGGLSASGVNAVYAGGAKFGVIGDTMSSTAGCAGVHGRGYAPNARGVWGTCEQGQGVRGETKNGVGLVGAATTGIGLVTWASVGTGIALRASGRVQIHKASGVATVVSTASSVTITPGLDVTPTSFVLLTPQGSLGGRDLWYTTDATANTITIRVGSAVTTDLAVGWLLLG